MNWPRLDRWFWLATLLATVVLVTRSALIADAHNESMDDTHHLRHGLKFLTGKPENIQIPANDPPLGQVLIALPMVASGCTPDRPIHDGSWPASLEKPKDSAIRADVLYGNRLRPETLLRLIAMWKALLFVPCVAIAFQWTRAIYGLQSAWLASALILVDPTIAANVAIAAPDTLGLTGIVVACFGIWRYCEAPTVRRLVVASFFVALAMLMKHTAVILPVVTIVFTIVYRNWRGPMRGALFVLLFMWVLLKFDISAPADQGFSMLGSLRAGGVKSIIADAMLRKWPLGTYIGCFASGLTQNAGGQLALLNGQIRAGGWWYYFLVLATYKVPIGVFAALALGAISYFKFQWRRAEMSIVIPLVAWTILMLSSNMNYSFRHFLPAYVFMLMLASRCASAGKIFSGIAWLATIVAAIDVARFHPDYLSYINFPREKIWMQITDSNLDWGQGVRQVKPWLDVHPQTRPVQLLARAMRPVEGAYWLDDRVKILARSDAPPSSGILIISPVWVCGVYDEGLNPYEFLQAMQPIDMIGHSMLVYDLDRQEKK